MPKLFKKNKLSQEIGKIQTHITALDKITSPSKVERFDSRLKTILIKTKLISSFMLCLGTTLKLQASDDELILPTIAFASFLLGAIILILPTLLLTSNEFEIYQNLLKLNALRHELKKASLSNTEKTNLIVKYRIGESLELCTVLAEKLLNDKLFKAHGLLQLTFQNKHTVLLLSQHVIKPEPKTSITQIMKKNPQAILIDPWYKLVLNEQNFLELDQISYPQLLNQKLSKQEQLSMTESEQPQPLKITPSL